MSTPSLVPFHHLSSPSTSPGAKVLGWRPKAQPQLPASSHRGASARGLAAETPGAYKDVNAVVRAAEGGGLCRKVARLVPLGVVKG